MRKYFFTFFLICYGISNSFAVPTTLDYGYAENNPLYFGNPSDATDDEIIEAAKRANIHNFII